MREERLPPPETNGGSLMTRDGYPEVAYEFGPRKHLRDHWRVVVRRKWVILTLVVTALAISTVYTFRQTPLYQATTKLEIQPELASVLPYEDFERSSSAWRFTEYLNTQIKHLTSRTLARRVVLAAGLDRRTEPKQEPADFASVWDWLTGSDGAERNQRRLTKEERTQQAIDEVLDAISVVPVRNSHMVEIDYTSPDPELAARVVNILAREYIEYNFQSKYDSTSRANEFLQKQLVDLKAKVEVTEEAQLNYARAHNIMSVNEKQDVVLQTLSDLNTELTVAQSARMSKQSAYQTLAGATPENFPQALRTPLIEELEGNLMQSEQELAKISAQLGPAMPQVKQLTGQVTEGREQLRHQKLLAIQNAQSEYQTALERERLLSEAVDNQKTQVNQLNEASIHYNILKREVETNKQLYDGLLQRMKEAGVAAGLKSSNIQVVDAAMVPAFPFSPSLRKNLTLALMLSLMAGLGLAFLLSYLDNTIKTPEDVEELVGLPSLGFIPSLDSGQRGRYGRLLLSSKNGEQDMQSQDLARHGVELASLVATSSLIAETFRGLRTALLLSTPEQPPKTIMVTSALPSEGKTTTVCNVALSFTQTGKRVLIIDCDMRQPRISKIFEQNGSMGLSEHLTGQVDFSDIIVESLIPNLFLVNAGTTPPNPGELLCSNRMQQALEQAAALYDIVLIDTPPILAVTDPLMVAPMTDGVILVTKGGKNPPEVLQKARKGLEMVHAKILGVVVNQVNLDSQDYSYYYHRYYNYDSYVSS